MSITININMKNVDKFSEALKEAYNMALLNTANRIKAELGYLIPTQSGGLRGSFTAIPTEEGIELGWSANYAGYVDKGAPPHTILPKGEALRFPTASGITFAKRVEHPGQPAQHFSREVGMAAMDILKEELRSAIIIATGRL